MEILKEIKEEQGSFYIPEGNERVGEIFFSMKNDDRMVIEHTEVSEKLSGRGIGKQLVDHAVEYAREKNLKIVPLCPFAKSVFERFPGYEDVQ